MKQIDSTSQLLADTPHSRLLNIFLQTGAIAREPQLEIILEQLNEIYRQRPGQRDNKDACERIAENSARLMLKYLELCQPEESEKLMYWIHSVLERRLCR